MAAVEFDMNFLYILPGWEGSAHDSRVLKDALEKWFSAPPGRYYLADAGYAATGGILLTPFKMVKYHSKEWGITEKQGGTIQFSVCISEKRSRADFRRFQGSFAILSGKGREGFSIFTQAKLIYALAAVHNFMNLHGANPFDEAIELELDDDSIDPRPPEDIDDGVMADRHMEITEMMWENRRGRISRRQSLEDEED